MVNEPRLPADLVTFGDRLRWAIEHDPEVETQAGAARALNVTAAYVGQLVSSTEPPGKKTLARLSKLLGVPEWWLLYGLNQNGSGQAQMGRSDDAEYWRRYDEIMAGDVPATVKVAQVDALTAFVRVHVQKHDAAAAEGRTELMKLEVEAGKARTANVARVEQRPPLDTAIAPRSSGRRKKVSESR